MATIIEKLIDGNKQFRQKFFDTDSTIFETLVQEGQKPKTLIIACSDSRVQPSMIFDCQPGELFVVRNVANLVPPYEMNGTYHGTSAALEFGVCFLDVEHIIILGHTKCGGVQALIQDADAVFDKKSNSFIARWMAIARPAYDKVVADHGQLTLDEKVNLCERYALIHSLHNLQTFPWIQERVQKGTLSLHAWCFDLSTGLIHQYNHDSNTWRA